MPILTRRIGESIIINGNIDVKVLSVKGNQIRLGIDAPENVVVHREEIYEKIQQEKSQPVVEEIKQPKITFKRRPYCQPTVNQNEFYCQP